MGALPPELKHFASFCFNYYWSMLREVQQERDNIIKGSVNRDTEANVCTYTVSNPTMQKALQLVNIGESEFSQMIQIANETYDYMVKEHPEKAKLIWRLYFAEPKRSKKKSQIASDYAVSETTRKEWVEVAFVYAATLGVQRGLVRVK